MRGFSAHQHTHTHAYTLNGVGSAWCARLNRLVSPRSQCAAVVVVAVVVVVVVTISSAIIFSHTISCSQHTDPRIKSTLSVCWTLSVHVRQVCRLLCIGVFHKISIVFGRAPPDWRTRACAVTNRPCIVDASFSSNNYAIVPAVLIDFGRIETI